MDIIEAVSFNEKDYIEDEGMSMVDKDNLEIVDINDFDVPNNQIIPHYLEMLITELDFIAKKYLGDNFSFSTLGLEVKNYSNIYDKLTTITKYSVFTKEYIGKTTDKSIVVSCKNIDNIKEFTELLLKDLLFDK